MIRLPFMLFAESVTQARLCFDSECRRNNENQTTTHIAACNATLVPLISYR